MARRRYQKGSIRKRGKRNPVWELQWWEDYIKPDGSIGRRRESAMLGLVSEMTYRQARKAAESQLRPLNQGKVLPLSRLLLREFVEKHFVPNVFPTLKPSTRKHYRITLDKHLLPAFGHMPLREINRLSIQEFVLKKADAGSGWHSCDHMRNLLSRIFTTASDWGFWNGDNPATRIRLPEKHPVREKHVLNPLQIQELLQILPEPVRTMVHLAVLTGLRVGELLALRHCDIDLDKREIHVEQAWYRGSMGSPKTKGSKRTIHMPDALIEPYLTLKAHPVQPEELIFKTRSGKPCSDTNLLHRFLKPAGDRMGAPWLNWHTLRRTHATLFQAAGGSLRDAQGQLGHSKASTTLEEYTLPLPACQREAVESLSRMVTNGDELDPIAKPRPLLSKQIQ